MPAAANVGRFQYTGQMLLSELGSSACPGAYHYKARLYSPCIGRFYQTDPIGYEDQINLYAYVGNDPVNRADPSGTTCDKDGKNCQVDELNRDPKFRSSEDYKKDTAAQTKVAASANALQKAVTSLKANPKGEVTVSVKYSVLGSRIERTASQTFSNEQLAEQLISTPLNVDTENHPTETRASSGPPLTLFDRATTGSSAMLQRTLYHEAIHYLDQPLRDQIPKGLDFSALHQEGYSAAANKLCRTGPFPCL